MISFLRVGWVPQKGASPAPLTREKGDHDDQVTSQEHWGADTGTGTGRLTLSLALALALALTLTLALRRRVCRVLPSRSAASALLQANTVGNSPAGTDSATCFKRASPSS